MIADVMAPLRLQRPLRIVEVRSRFLTASVDDGVAMSFAPMRRRAMAFIELVTEDGLTGYGESWVNYPPWAIEERRATLERGIGVAWVEEPLRGDRVAELAEFHCRTGLTVRDRREHLLARRFRGLPRRT